MKNDEIIKRKQKKKERENGLRPWAAEATFFLLF